jgi:DNA-binding CsgD family transcriptional regulator
VHDSIFNLETTKQISEIEIKYETEKIERENILLKTNLKLKTKKNENRKYIIVALFTGITIIIILLILIFILIKLRNNLHKKMLILYKKDSEISKLNINKKNNENKRILAERKIKEKENEILENKKIEIETISSFQKQKIGFHNRQLSSSTLLVISKNDRLQNTKKKIEQLILQKPKKIKKFGEIIIEIDNNIESENHWEDFKNHFNQVHPDFLIRLKSKHSNLTQKDLRFCAYLRINLGTNEISRLLNIQTNSVKKIKIRLKKKLTLSRIINLEKYVEKI